MVFRLPKIFKSVPFDQCTNDVGTSFLIPKQGLLGHFLVSRYLTPCTHPGLSDVISDVRDSVATDYDAQGNLEASGVKGDQTHFLQFKSIFPKIFQQSWFPGPWVGK